MLSCVILCYTGHSNDGRSAARIVLEQELSGWPVEACLLPAQKGKFGSVVYVFASRVTR